MWWKFFDKKLGEIWWFLKGKRKNIMTKCSYSIFILFILVKFIVPDWWSLRTELNQAHSRCFSKSSYIVATHWSLICWYGAISMVEIRWFVYNKFGEFRFFSKKTFFSHKMAKLCHRNITIMCFLAIKFSSHY
jgi:hypothetical protein